jgi:phospholipid/cholesterol/gamma-HCH transport system permease protein
LVLVKFRPELFRLLAEVSVGSGLLFVAGGTVGIIFMLSGAVGIEVGLEGYQGLQILGLAPLSGYVSAFANTRELAPLIAAVALSSQLGCKFTAQLGAMRINEEVDALEMMAVPPIPYLVSTRVIAALVAVIPLYLVGLFAAYVGTELTISVFFQQSAGTYAHYFHVFIQPADVIYSVVKVVVFALLIIPVQCFYGFYASGGPEGVGKAAGRGIRSASVLIAVADMLMTFLFWGTAQTVGLSA